MIKIEFSAISVSISVINVNISVAVNYLFSVNIQKFVAMQYRHYKLTETLITQYTMTSLEQIDVIEYYSPIIIIGM